MSFLLAENRFLETRDPWSAKHDAREIGGALPLNSPYPKATRGTLPPNRSTRQNIYSSVESTRGLTKFRGPHAERYLDRVAASSRQWRRQQKLSLWDASQSQAPPIQKATSTPQIPPQKTSRKSTAVGAWCDGAPASHPAALNFGGPVATEAGSRISEPRSTRLRLVGTVLRLHLSRFAQARSLTPQTRASTPAAVGCWCLGRRASSPGGRASVVCPVDRGEARPCPKPAFSEVRGRWGCWVID